MRRALRTGTLAAALGLVAQAALAHGGEAHGAGPQGWGEVWGLWELEPAVLTLLALSAGLYARGVARVWRAAGRGRGVTRRAAACFAGGWAALVVALVSPMHPLGEQLFSAHMTQHEVLMLVAAPLLVLGQPLVAFAWALPKRAVQRLGAWAKAPAWRRAWGGLTRPFMAFLVHAVALWVWHIPGLFEATLTSNLVHTLQHTAFLGTALLFWWALLGTQASPSSYGAGILYLFMTALHSGLLGALLTFAATLWYPAYAGLTDVWGLTPLEDQQLGGLIMWVPAALVYVAAALAMLAGWLRAAEERTRQREGAPVRTALAPPLSP